MMIQANVQKPLMYIEQLTWLRGFAAFLVIVSHTLRVSEVKYFLPYENTPVPILSLLDLGYYGVALFFALSGCTLFLSNARNEQVNLSGFYIKRFFRIWPAFAVSLAVSIAFGFLFRHFYGTPVGSWIERQFFTPFSLSDLLNYLLLVFDFTGPPELFNGPYWTLPIEFQYYLLFPLLVFALKYLGTLGPMLVGLLIYNIPTFVPLGSQVRMEFFILAFVFCGGMLIGHMLAGNHWRFKRPGIIAFILCVLATVALRQYHGLPAPFLGLYGTPWACIGFFAVLTVFAIVISDIAFHPRIESFLKTYGMISYSTYLYHSLLLGTAFLIAKNTGMTGGALKIWFCLIFTLVATWFVAKLSFHCVEAPSNKYGHQLAARGWAPDMRAVFLAAALGAFLVVGMNMR